MVCVGIAAIPGFGNGPGAHAADLDIVEVEEVVFQVELGEGEGDVELGVRGGEVLVAEEGDDMVGPFGFVS